MAAPAPTPRAAELRRALGLQPHPEGGAYREVFRSAARVVTADGRGARSALTTIDFLLDTGEHSAWHRVASDEVWHLLEGGPLRLWLLAPALDHLDEVVLAPAGGGCAPRHVVPAGWWQAAAPAGGHAYVGATVGPGFEFADFMLGRDDRALRDVLAARWPSLARLL